MKKNDDDIIFQIIDWHTSQTEPDEDVESDEEVVPLYNIELFGRDETGKTVFVNVENFTPYFYIEIPEKWNKFKVDTLVNEVKRMVSKKFRSGLKSHDVVKRHKFYGFTNYTEFKFLRLIFHNHTTYREFDKVFKYKSIYNILLGRKPRRYKVYESNIDPMLRCMHIRDLNATGWIRIPAGKYEKYDNFTKPTYSSRNIKTNWTSIEKHESTTMAPFIIASYDIECTSGDGSFPQSNRDSDKVIQIGTTCNKYGESECFYRSIITLGTCDPIDGVDVIECNTEKEVLLEWTKMIRTVNPDIMTGYNIFGFDYKYLYDRSKKLGCSHEFSKLDRFNDTMSEFVEKELKSSALGDNKLLYYNMIGRVQVDLMKVIQRDHKLESYKLDYVAAWFIREDITGIEYKERKGKKQTLIKTKSTFGLKEGQFITLYYNDGLSDNKYRDGKKFRILELRKDEILLDDDIKMDYDDEIEHELSYYWCQAKDDVPPRMIFKLQEGSSSDRAIIAKYCIQDCELCNKLIDKLKIIVNNIGMSNVCSVPLSYIFLRGQGIKLFSLVAKKCRIKNHLIQVLNRPKKVEDGDEKDSYEGAIVIDPISGVHYSPTAVLDYASLYPKSMIHRNLSHECIVEDNAYDNLPGYTYTNVTFTMNNAKKVCRYARKNDGTIGIIPEICNDLLDARSAKKADMKKATDPFVYELLDGLQLAYKLTANSLYGQIGASTSNIRYKEIAASTTATGRDMLMFAMYIAIDLLTKAIKYILDGKKKKYQKFMNDLYDGKILELGISEKFTELLKTAPDLIKIVGEKKFLDKGYDYKNREEFIDFFEKAIIDLIGDKQVVPKIVYGDTDSIFVDFQLKQSDGSELEGLDLIDSSIKLGILTGLFSNKLMPYPHDLEYEKTFWPFILITKKKYVGNKYETDPKKYKLVPMGIVLKRRDNAPIVKIVCGGIIKKILNERNAQKAVQFARDTLKKILKGGYSMDKFIITKTLRTGYKDRSTIVHAVLADRMSKRDPGNKPQSNDRIPFAYVKVDNKKVKVQGDRVEHPDYIIKNNLELDYLFYIERQIMNPAIQFLELLVKEPEKIFKDYIIREKNRRKGVKPINYYQEDSDEDSDVYNIMDTESDHEELSGVRKGSKRKLRRKIIEIEPDGPCDSAEISMDMDSGEIKIKKSRKDEKKPSNKSSRKPVVIHADNKNIGDTDIDIGMEFQ